MNREELGKKWQRIIAKAWMDDEFKKKLLKDPVTVLKEEWFEIPPGIKVKIVETTEKEFCLVLPPKPTEDNLSEKDLDRVVGGVKVSTCHACPVPIPYPNYF